MTPAELVAALDRQLALHGQNATLRRRIGTGGTYVDVPIRLRLHGYATTDLVSGIKVTDSKFIASPTPFVTAGAAWPGAAGGSGDVKIGDFILVEGRQRAITQVDAIRVSDVMVRIEGRVSG